MYAPCCRGTALLDNRHVVPYNPYLLHKYNCHINVEVTVFMYVVKYLFKYVCKGHDLASYAFTGTSIIEDEISNYQCGR